MKQENSNTPQNLLLQQHNVSGASLSDTQLRNLAKKVCNGHQHAMRYQNMLSACFKMGKLVLEEIERKKPIAC